VVLITTEAGNLRCMLKCEFFYLGIVERVVNRVPVPDVCCMCGVNAAGSLHVPDNLLGGDLGVVVVLVNGKHQCQGENMVQMFYELLICMPVVLSILATTSSLLKWMKKASINSPQFGTIWRIAWRARSLRCGSRKYLSAALRKSSIVWVPPRMVLLLMVK